MDIKNAVWIKAPRALDCCPSFETTVSVNKKIKKAVIEATALGVYRLYLNGEDITFGWLCPGCTDYTERLQYQTYDVSEKLKKENRVRILAAGGWSASNMLGLGRAFLQDEIFVTAEIVIDYEDGSRDVIRTDKNWDVYPSCVLSSGHYKGEIIDYTQDTSAVYCKAEETETEFTTTLIPQAKAPVREQLRIAARELIVSPSGKRVIDFGQNMAGYVEVRVNGKKGDHIVLRHGEILDAESEPYYKNLRTATAKMEYTLGHDGLNVLTPLFSFQGYRYCELVEFPYETVNLADFTSVVLHTDMERTGWFSSGNEKLNRLYDCILWNQRSNFLEIPTDCPQRDERLGWLGDAQVFCKSAAFNYDVYDFYKVWLRDVVSGQLENGGIRALSPYPRKGYQFRVSAAWADAITIIPWELYRIYGDDSIIRECFDAMCKYVDYMHATGEEEFLWLGGEHFGDWLSLDGPNPRSPMTDKNFIASAYFAYSTELVIRCGEVIGRNTDKYREMLPKIKEAFRARFVKDGLPVTADTLATSVILLKFNLVTEEERPVTAAHLASLVDSYENRLMTGVVGAPFILHVLSENGYPEKAYDMLLCEKIPSWLGMLRYGATTLWERLDTYTDDGAKDVYNASFNHYMFGAVLDWMIEKAGGVNLVRSNGKLSILWKPLVEERLGHVNIEYKTGAGTVRTGWNLAYGNVRYELDLPAGLDCEVVFPDGSREKVSCGSHLWVK